MKLEKAKKYLENVKIAQIDKVAEGYAGYKDIVKSIETVLQALDNSVSKDKLIQILNKKSFVMTEFPDNTKIKLEKYIKVKDLEKLLEDK